MNDSNLHSTTGSRPVRALQAVLRTILIVIAIPFAIVGTLLQTIGFLTFSAGTGFGPKTD
ncbi:hypothetical protein GCM10023171_35780 [Microbacterium panaciterrae]|uniref:Uncharacterized protein n=1 Tax=Microbacterium panaciterrae TaxID=985759 RepID=A0ABP8PSG2_9MICO